MLRRGLEAWGVLCALLSLSLTAGAIDGANPGNAALGERYRPPHRIYEGLRHTPGLQRLLSERHEALGDLRVRSGVEWWGRWNEDLLLPRVLLGAAAPVAPGVPAVEELPTLARDIVDANRALLGVTSDELILHRNRAMGDVRLVQFLQQIHGVPVRPSFLNVVFFQRPDELVLMRLDAEVFPEATLDVRPDLEPADAILRASQWVARDGEFTAEDASLEITPAPRADQKGVEPRLVYRTRVTVQNPYSRYQVLVDAHDGSVVAAYDTISYIDIEGNISGWASPGLLPDVGSNPETVQPLAGIQVTVPGAGTAVTDADGNFLIPFSGTNPIAGTLQLFGPFVNVNNEQGADLQQGVTFVPGGTNDFVMNGATTGANTAQVNGAIHTNDVHQFIKDIDPTFTTLDFPIACNCNINSSCNAFYDGTINFFLPGGGCVNTAYSTVVYHEYGHGVVDAVFPFFVDGAYNEGISDVCATMNADDPTVGALFQGSGFIRDVDVQDRFYPQDVNNQIHDAGLIIGGAWWDTLGALDGTVGHTEGLVLARNWYLNHMFFLTGEINPVLTIDVLTLDDDDGNLLNGTPHYPEINEGFSAHGLDAPDLQFITYGHTPLPDTPNETFPYEVLITAEPLGGDIATLQLGYSLDGQSFSFVGFDPTGNPDEYVALIPPQASPAQVRYYIQGTDTDGNIERLPDGAPAALFSFFVGNVTEIFFDNMTTDQGWTHVEVAQQDDWQRGGANIQGDNPWDPLDEASPPSVWGNDLNPAGFNGDYQNNVNNYLESPSIDCSAFAGVRLQYRRWLTVEKRQYDTARLTVDGVQTWQNDFAVDHLDTSWVEVNHDISAQADGDSSVRLRFTLITDGGLVFGGWNIDDVRVFVVEESNPDIFSFSVPQVPAAAGASGVVVPVLGQNDQEIGGYTIVLQHDPATIDVEELTLVGTTVESLAPDFFAPSIDPTGTVSAQVLLDVTFQDLLPTGIDQDLLHMILSVAPGLSPGTALPLDLVTEGGTPVQLAGMQLGDGSVETPFLADGAVVISAGNPSFVRGDANGDGSINLPDAGFTLFFLFAQGETPGCLDAVDVNDSGNLNLQDATHLLGYLFTSGPPPAPPFPDPGPDPSDDALDCIDP